MKRLTLICCLLPFLAACGADGEPTAPVLSGEVSLGYSSKSGVVSGTDLGLCLGPACK
ncbi:MAG: hypothetical protein KUG69_03830 [Marinosulfonomonas sp.]|nr:hypothetical protein [Marinosulfonomonas sp.]